MNRDGIVCADAYSGGNRGDQWPGSRVISAQKANTANAFSVPLFALSTANLYAATQPDGTLFGLQESNPVDPSLAYGGNPEDYGRLQDPMVGKRIGGVNVFGGGLSLYSPARPVARRHRCKRRYILFGPHHGLVTVIPARRAADSGG